MTEFRLALLAFASVSTFAMTSPASAKPASNDVTAADLRIGSKPGNPTFALPDNMRLLSAFGERPVFSPDGMKIAFVGESYGDAFEMDLVTGEIRNLTAHAAHKGFLRVHYLADGNFLLLGPRVMGKDREATRNRHIELFWMSKDGNQAPVALNRTVFEGIATSRTSNLIAWTEITPLTDRFADNQRSTVMTGTIEVRDRKPVLTGVRTVFETTAQTCLVEPQDFLPGDTGLTMPCYYMPFEKASRQTDVISVDFATGQQTTYPTPNIYGEVEGLFPDGKHTLVECSADRAAGMDMCVLEMKADRPAYTRLTRIMDHGRWKYGNPVVSPDGKMIAVQIGLADVVEAGVGQGIVLMDLNETP